MNAVLLNTLALAGDSESPRITFRSLARYKNNLSRLVLR